MKAIVMFLRDQVVVERTITGEKVTAKILKGGRGYVTADGNTYIFRRIESIDLIREDA